MKRDWSLSTAIKICSNTRPSARLTNGVKERAMPGNTSTLVLAQLKLGKAQAPTDIMMTKTTDLLQDHWDARAQILECFHLSFFKQEGRAGRVARMCVEATLGRKRTSASERSGWAPTLTCLFADFRFFFFFFSFSCDTQSFPSHLALLARNLRECSFGSPSSECLHFRQVKCS